MTLSIIFIVIGLVVLGLSVPAKLIDIYDTSAVPITLFAIGSLSVLAGEVAILLGL